ncbi:MAG: YdcH family protein [Acetobacteraceae bacterium]
MEEVSMSLQSRLSALKERHASLETRIAEEHQRPLPDSETLARLKREKLHVKEEMERLRGQGTQSAE